MNRIELLKKYAPELHFADKADLFPHAEVHFPTSVDSFVANASTQMEWRLFGKYTLKSRPLQTPPDLNRLHDCLPPPKLWERLLTTANLLEHGVSLCYVQEEEIMQAREAGCGAVLPDDKATADRKAMGCGCLMLLLPLAGLVALLTLWWSWEVSLPVALGLVIFGLSPFAPLPYQPRVAALGFAPFVWLAINQIFGNLVLAWSCSGLLATFVLVLIVAEIARGDGLRGLIDWLSGLDNCTAYAAMSKIAKIPAGPPVYYGRIVQLPAPGRWRTVLQYWFFYAMNDWRTIHFGIDDHEGDWETIQVFLPVDPTERPMVAYSAHFDVTVRPLTRQRPVAYVGAGSHANYPEPGSYSLLHLIFKQLARNPFVAIPALATAISTEAPNQIAEVYAQTAHVEAQARTIIRQQPQQISQKIRATSKELRQALTQVETPRPATKQAVQKKEEEEKEDATAPSRPETEVEGEDLIMTKAYKRVKEQPQPLRPIVDRALGDGRVVRSADWAEPTIINDTTPWVRFQGRWGISVLWPGESGPGGPKYDQDGNVRLAWADPVAWAGLPQ